MLGLVEASLETIPEDLRNTEKARRLSRRMRVPPEYLILDRSLFHEEMKLLGIESKRGRPDIVFMFLQATQYSPLNARGVLRVFVHTLNDEVIEVDPAARLPKNYYQFVNLLQHLYMNGRVPRRGRPLLKLKKNKTLREHLEELGVREPVLLHERGEPVDCRWLGERTFPRSCLLVGGFPHGDFSPATEALAKHKVSLFGGAPLDAWIVADRIVCCLESSLGLI